MSSDLPPSIAVVGMAGRFPGARDLELFWENLRLGVESIRQYSPAELRAAGLDAAADSTPGFVPCGALLDGIDHFDAGFFGISPREAAILDPQHRFFLETAWEAFENASIVPGDFAGAIGVFAGSGWNAYLIHNLLANRAVSAASGIFHLKQTGNDKDVLATRVSYQFDLRGPSINVQTACSTSLVAIHLACQSLLQHECDLALAGGVTIEIPHRPGHIYREGEILSSDGHCRAFDASASGTVFGSGAAVVVLRRLEDALRAGDFIHAVVLGSAINNDGSRKAGFLAPSVDGQAQAIAEAIAVAGIEPHTIGMVEAHGTGTRVGDPIEVAALKMAFGPRSPESGRCALGSVKTNIGHLDAAAGAAGFVKAVLALRHRTIPPSLHFEKPNPQIDFDASQFYVPRQADSWPEQDHPRRAGVTSLGIGGTNAHVVIEEAPPESSTPFTTTAGPSLLSLSARSEATVSEAAQRLAAYLERHPETALSDVAWTLQTGRRAFAWRRICVCATPQEAIAALRRPSPPQKASPGEPPRVAFLFPGQGAQYAGQGRDVAARWPEFRTQFDLCCTLFANHLGFDLAAEINSGTRLDETLVTQPALFAIEYALARLWMSWGLVPDALAGHSLGELVAACLSGVFTLPDAVSVVALRARLMQDSGPGAMLALAVNEARAQGFLDHDLALAAVNGPEQCVISGPLSSVDALVRRLEQQGVAHRRLKSRHAFHSPMMGRAAEQLADYIAGLSLSSPAIPFLSNLTGGWADAGDVRTPLYWARQMTGTVRFADNIAHLAGPPRRTFLEVGPGRTLSTLVSHSSTSGDRPVALPGIQSTPGEAHSLLNAAGGLWGLGARLNWPALRGPAPARRIPLPTYPFERQRHWIDPDLSSPAAQPESAPSPASPSPADLSGDPSPLTLSVPVWNAVDLESAPDDDPQAPILVFEDRTIGPRLSAWLERQGRSVIRVRRSAFPRPWPAAGGHFHLNPRHAASFSRLFATLARQNRLPRRILYLWPIDTRGPERIFSHLLLLAQSIAAHPVSPLDLCVVTEGARAPGLDSVHNPDQAVVDGPCLVLPLEASNVRSATIDLPAGALSSLAAPPAGHSLIASLANAFLAVPAGATAALRDRRVWLRGFEPWQPTASSSHRLRGNGVYLITGAFGALGSLLASHLAATLQPTLILAGRLPVPSRSRWDQWLENHGPDNEISRRIALIRRLEDAGASIISVSGALDRPSALRRLARRLSRRGVVLHGVFHAAGLLDDKPIRLKSVSSALRVLAPKTRAVDKLRLALAPLAPEFFAVFSSVSAVAPPEGQIDYAAANAYLDAWAQSSRSQTPVISLGWGRWDAGVGSSAAPSQSLFPALREAPAPAAGTRRLDFTLAANSHWMVGDHRLRGGSALLPGTAYLDLLAHAASGRACAVENIRFSVPLLIPDRRPLPLRLEFAPDGEHQNFRFLSSPPNSGAWEEHSSGRLLSHVPRRPPPLDLSAINARCRGNEIDFQHRLTHQEKYFHFGPHWRCLRRLHAAAGEAVAELEIPPGLTAGAAQHIVHPALLDLAGGVALYLIPEYEQSDSLYLPFSYDRVVIWDRLPERIFSHIVPHEPLSLQPANVSFDLTVTSPDGKVLVQIAALTFKRIADPRALLRPDPAAPAAIQPDQGLRAIDRILSATHPPPHVLITASPLAGAPAHAPAPTPALPATRDVDATLAAWWEDLLGVPSPPPDLDFFEAGGHSLTAVRLFQRIKEVYRADLPLSVLFQARTIPKLSDLIRGAISTSVPAEEWSPVVEIRKSGTEPPLFLVSGAGGNVVNFNAIERHLPTGRPVFALQPPGLDGKQPFLLRIEDIAELYLREIRRIQPAGPYFLGGYSFGGLVTYEMAQRLRREGEPVAVLALLDVIEWHYWQSVGSHLPWKRRAALLGQRAHHLLLGRDRWAYAASALRRRLFELAHHIFVPSASFSARLGTLEDANRFAAGRYHPQPYPGLIDLFRCSERSELDGDDPFLGWVSLAHGGIQVHEVPGDHLNLTQEPNVRHLASALLDVLSRPAAPLIPVSADLALSPSARGPRP